MLHTVNKSPYRSDSLKTCAAYVRSDDAILLIEDGVLRCDERWCRFSVVGWCKCLCLGARFKSPRDW